MITLAGAYIKYVCNVKLSTVSHDIFYHSGLSNICLVSCGFEKNILDKQHKQVLQVGIAGV